MRSLRHPSGPQAVIARKPLDRRARKIEQSAPRGPVALRGSPPPPTALVAPSALRLGRGAGVSGHLGAQLCPVGRQALDPLADRVPHVVRAIREQESGWTPTALRSQDPSPLRPVQRGPPCQDFAGREAVHRVSQLGRMWLNEASSGSSTILSGGLTRSASRAIPKNPFGVSPPKHPSQ